MTTTCPACHAPASGSFCSNCGAALGPRSCSHCQAALSPQARFCHRCGTPVIPDGHPSVLPPVGPSERTPWIVAGTAVVALISLLAYKVAVQRPAPLVPDMANTGAPSAAGAARPAPDISRMSPRERFDRLYDRIMRAVENTDTAGVVNFAPMALGAYAQLDTIDPDARYHAAMIHLSIGEDREAVALGDSILQESPGHLFGYVILGEVAERQGRTAELKRSYADFQRHYDAEMKAGRVEYAEHRPVIEEFRRQAGERRTGNGER